MTSVIRLKLAVLIFCFCNRLCAYAERIVLVEEAKARR